MVKPGFGFLQGRRKSSGNPMDDVNLNLTAADSSPVTESSGFRVLNTNEADRRKAEQAIKKTEKSKFGRFSGFGSGPKGRSMSVDEDSPSSSKRDSKSSSGTHSSRPYHPSNYGGSSSSTLPSSADTDLNENMFASLPPRPPVAQHSSSPSLLSMGAGRKELPMLPKSRTTDMSGYNGNSYGDIGYNTSRNRGMTNSSYASTAIPPKLEADLDFGSSGFDDLFSGMNRKQSPDFGIDPPGRSLLAGKRQIQAEPIKIDRKLDVEPPPMSWDSRDSNENLISSPRDGNSPSPPPPPVPKHKYAPVASHSPVLNVSGGFEDEDAKLVRQSVMQRKSILEHSPQQKQPYTTSSSARSLQTPLSSTSTSNNTTPRAPLRAAVSPTVEEDEDNLFAPPRQKHSPERKPVSPQPKESIPQPPTTHGEPSRRVMTAAEFQAQKRYQMTQPADESSDEEEYDDEEEAIEKRLREEQARREQQRMQMAREHLRRSTTAPADPNHPASGMGTSFMGNGFPSEISKDADQWDDEDVPLGILKEHGFPNRGKAPNQPANATQSYFRSATPTMPDRPASAGVLNNRAPNYRPPFARGLPDDPHATFVGGGIVLPSNRESMGFNRAASVYGGEATGGMPYQDAQQPYTSLVDQIHIRDMSKQKYMGGASSKNKPQQGPYTGLLGSQMQNQALNPTRMSQMPMQGMQMQGMQGMPGMNGMNQMNPMMSSSMPMMGMNQMNYPMGNPNDMMQLQAMLFAQSMQQAQQMMQANQMMGQQDPRMSMAPQQHQGMQNPNFGNNNFLNVGLPGMNPHRPMSIMSFGGGQQNRPYSTPTAGGMPQGGFPPQMAPNAGYTPSIAPSERSNIGLASRYRPVITSNGMNDGVSTVSSKTLQASGGASATSTQKVKGILKKSGVTQVTVREDDEDDWAKMQARKNKFGNGAVKRDDPSGLQELARAVDGF